MESHYTLFFDEIDKDSLPLVGGKGANLGEMTRAGFPVPGGFCVTTTAYNKFIEQNQHLGFIAEKLLDGVRSLQTSVQNLEILHSAGTKLRKKLAQSAMPDAVAREIVSAWKKVGQENAYAVRSSATAEDLVTASFAGQQDTYLNIIGEQALLGAVRNCWASLFTDPGWTPLFINASGLVMEIGGQLTHGTVIAREYGIPAVVGIVDATRTIQTGQKIRVDGNAGFVQVIE